LEFEDGEELIRRVKEADEEISRENLIVTSSPITVNAQTLEVVGMRTSRIEKQ